MLSIPDSATEYGFVIEGLGAHSSRTIMLAELRLLLHCCPSNTDRQGYRKAVLEDNALLKNTESTRKKSLRYLSELYSLDRGILLFRALHDLWDHQEAAQPLLAMLCALARDPSLRATASVVQTTPIGSVVSSQMLTKAVAEHYRDRVNSATLAKIGRNAASSWTQSGHLSGRTNKVRVRAISHPTSVTYALFLGYLCGVRGEALFHTPWAQLLDTPFHLLHEQAFRASQRGWLEYRHSGAITSVTFSYLLRGEVTQ